MYSSKAGQKVDCMRDLLPYATAFMCDRYFFYRSRGLIIVRLLCGDTARWRWRWAGEIGGAAAPAVEWGQRHQATVRSCTRPFWPLHPYNIGTIIWLVKLAVSDSQPPSMGRPWLTSRRRITYPLRLSAGRLGG